MDARKFAVMFFTFIGLIAWITEEAFSIDLTQFQWKNRLLFIFAVDDSHPLFKELQSQIAVQKAEVDDRDLIVFEVPAKGTARMDTIALERKEADSIRHQFAISEDTFSLILVGKDGGIKLKSSDQVGLTEVFELIDSMPMRQREMQKKSP